MEYAANFANRSQMVTEGSTAEKDLLEVIRLLGRGSILPERFYRNGIERDSDELLIQHGIKHLHLGGATSDTILFLVEYEDKILLLEVNDHSHFKTKPIGSILGALHHSATTKADKESALSRIERVATKAKIAARGLLPRRKPSASEGDQ